MAAENLSKTPLQILLSVCQGLYYSFQRLEMKIDHLLLKHGTEAEFAECSNVPDMQMQNVRDGVWSISEEERNAWLKRGEDIEKIHIKKQSSAEKETPPLRIKVNLKNSTSLGQHYYSIIDIQSQKVRRYLCLDLLIKSLGRFFQGIEIGLTKLSLWEDTG